MNKKALITGITGQDGSYLAELLLFLGYEVHGIIRRSSTFNTKRIDHLYKDLHLKDAKLFLHYGDLTDSGNVEKLINSIKPDEVYNLGAQSHVKVSFEMPEYTCNTNGLGVLRILEAIKNSGLPIKFYQASSSEMFGNSPAPQSENTIFDPKSPYAVSKTLAFYMVRLYREAYGIFACNGILFNHESPRRGETFVTRKITRGIARIKAGLDKKIYLGNLSAKRDWGFAPEYVEIMRLILQQKKPSDYIVSSGKNYSAQDFLEKAFFYSGLGNWKKYVEFDERYLRPIEVENLIGDCSKAQRELNWNPKIGLEDLVKIMVDADFREINLEVIGEGDKILQEKFPNKWWRYD